MLDPDLLQMVVAGRRKITDYKFDQLMALVQIEQDWRESFCEQRQSSGCSHLLRHCRRCKEKMIMVSTTFVCMDTQLSRCLGCSELWWESEFSAPHKRSEDTPRQLTG